MADEHTTTDDAVKEPPAGYIAEDEVSKNYVSKDFMAAEIKRRLAKKQQAAPDELLESEEFKQKALKAWGVEPEGRKKPDGEQLEKLYSDWEQKHLKPMREATEKQRQEIERLRTRDLFGQIVTGAAPFVQDQLLQSPVPNQPPPVVHFLAPYFGYDEEHGGWFVKDGEGFAYSSQPKAGAPYKTAAEFIAEWAKDKANANWVKDQRQRGANLGKPSTDATTGTIKSRADFKSVAEKVAFIKEHGQKAFENLPAK